MSDRENEGKGGHALPPLLSLSLSPFYQLFLFATCFSFIVYLATGIDNELDPVGHARRIWLNIKRTRLLLEIRFGPARVPVLAGLPYRADFFFLFSFSFFPRAKRVLRFHRLSKQRRRASNEAAGFYRGGRAWQ